MTAFSFLAEVFPEIRAVDIILMKLSVCFVNPNEMRALTSALHFCCCFPFMLDGFIPPFQPFTCTNK